MDLSTQQVESACRVCGDKARGLNFDVVTCMSCKAFFRRNALSKVCAKKKENTDKHKCYKTVFFSFDRKSIHVRNNFNVMSLNKHVHNV